MTLRDDGVVEVADNRIASPIAIETAPSSPMVYESGELAIVRALSSHSEVRQRRCGEERLTRYGDGRPLAPSAVATASAGAPDTRVTLLASCAVFEITGHDPATVARQLRDLDEPGSLLQLTWSIGPKSASVVFGTSDAARGDRASDRKVRRRFSGYPML